MAPTQGRTTEELTRDIQLRLGEEYVACGNVEDVGKSCPCPGACPLHGNCAACVAWHRDHARTPLPCCLRSLQGVSFTQCERLRNLGSA